MLSADHSCQGRLERIFLSILSRRRCGSRPGAVEAMRLRAYAYANDQLVGQVALDVIDRRLWLEGDDR